MCSNDMFRSYCCKSCSVKQVTEKEEYTYTVSPGGKCMTLGGKDPKFEYFGNKGSECERKCDNRPDCFGYSVSGFDNCLIWLQRDIMGGGEEWGGADCHIKDLDMCAGKQCVDCLDYEPDDGESYCGYSDAGCELASMMKL